MKNDWEKPLERFTKKQNQLDVGDVADIKSIVQLNEQVASIDGILVYKITRQVTVNSASLQFQLDGVEFHQPRKINDEELRLNYLNFKILKLVIRILYLLHLNVNIDLCLSLRIIQNHVKFNYLLV